MKINEHKLDTCLSFLIYSGGLASMLLADLFVSKNYDVKFISNWAFLKSAILILSTVCLLGYDILFVRDISLIKRYWKKFLFQTILISITSVFFISIFRGESFTYSVILFGAILSLSILNYISASNRALMNLWKAQLSLNFWKILMVIFLIFTMFDSPIFYYSISLILALLISIITKGDFGASKLVEEKILIKDANRMGLYFLLSNLTLIFAVNGEQFVINLYGDPNTSSYLFIYLTAFTPIALSVNGFLGFYFGPKIRSDKDYDLNKYVRFTKSIFVYSVIITILSVTIGYIYMIFFLRYKIQDVSIPMVVILSVLCIIRGVYTSTSIGIGIFGQRDSLKKSSIIFWIITIIYILLIVFVLKYFNKEYVPLAIATLSLFNWTGRLLVSNYFTVRELKKTLTAYAKY